MIISVDPNQIVPGAACPGSTLFAQTSLSEYLGSHLSQSLNLEGRQGTTDDVATIPFHLSLSSAALRESLNSIPVHSLMLSSHLFCLPLLAPFTVPCRIVFAMPGDIEMSSVSLTMRSSTPVILRIITVQNQCM